MLFEQPEKVRCVSCGYMFPPTAKDEADRLEEGGAWYCRRCAAEIRQERVHQTIARAEQKGPEGMSPA